MLRARLAFCFVNFWPPHDFQEDFIFGSHSRRVTVFKKKIDFLFPSFCGEPNRHPKCFPVFTLAVAGGSPPCRPSRSPCEAHTHRGSAQVRHGRHRLREVLKVAAKFGGSWFCSIGSDMSLTFKIKNKIWKYLEFTSEVGMFFLFPSGINEDL